MTTSEGNLNAFSDKELWDCLQNNQFEAFSTLFHRHYQVLYSYGLKISQNDDLTKDCIQESFAGLWVKRAALPVVTAVKPYLFTILRRQIYTARLLAAKQSEQDRQYHHYEFDLVISHEDFLIQQDLSDKKQLKLKEALMMLGPRQKEVIYLRFFDDLSCGAIAEIMAINYQSVVNLIHEAIKKLREHVVCLLPLIAGLIY